MKRSLASTLGRMARQMGYADNANGLYKTLILVVAAKCDAVGIGRWTRCKSRSRRAGGFFTPVDRAQGRSSMTRTGRFDAEIPGRETSGAVFAALRSLIAPARRSLGRIAFIGPEAPFLATIRTDIEPAFQGGTCRRRSRGDQGKAIPMLMKVQLRTLPTQVAAVLVRRIADGEFHDGRAPSELQISVEFGVSRAVAREALKILSSLDMVEIAQGRRVTLRPIAEWDYLSPLLIEWLPQAQVRELLLELHDARLIFEPPTAARAARSLTNEDLTRLRRLLDAMVSNEEDPDAYLQLDLEFHMEICRATRNRILDRFMYASRWWQTASRRISNQAPHALPTATEQHRAVYEALAARDPKRAEAAMRRHLENNTVAAVIGETAEAH